MKLIPFKSLRERGRHFQDLQADAARQFREVSRGQPAVRPTTFLEQTLSVTNFPMAFPRGHPVRTTHSRVTLTGSLVSPLNSVECCDRLFGERPKLTFSGRVSFSRLDSLSAKLFPGTQHHPGSGFVETELPPQWRNPVPTRVRPPVRGCAEHQTLGVKIPTIRGLPTPIFPTEVVRGVP